MKRIFACLANSKKYTERCVAGIELTRGVSGYSTVKDNDKPRWIRPVSAHEHGEVPVDAVDHLHLLDIVEMDAIKNISQGYQSENVIYGKEGFVCVGKVPLSTKYLDKFVPPASSFLFMNKEKAVPADQINKLDHSLIFIKPTDVIFHEASTVKGGTQVRSTFMYGQISYDLPITDVNFLNRFVENPKGYSSSQNVYFTVSLGLEFQGLHYKLIAGVICF